ncbi:DUF6500 family protein [Serratia plymuthica]|uniref:DUF6500 family protein n=1 Tax=Serratia plymuthica TaxID=82996 RepID=UPI001F537D3F|nr:DUF6500 family protein [Serratia plymuthica]UNK27309.1 DUF6500 family protein [Serratia plymuthica]
MRVGMKEKIIRTCEAKIVTKGSNVGLSFYAFFANKNDEPELLMEVAHWWIMEMKLDHFEKAEKIKSLVLAMK